MGTDTNIQGAVFKAHLAENLDAPRLEEFADDGVRTGEVLFDAKNTAALLGELDRSGGTGDGATANDDVVVVVAGGIGAAGNITDGGICGILLVVAGRTKEFGVEINDQEGRKEGCGDEENDLLLLVESRSVRIGVELRE